MKLTPELEQMIVDKIRRDPDRAIVLPDWCYWKGHDQPVIYVDGLPTRLVRYLYEKLVGPLEYENNLTPAVGAHPRNVNPFLFTKQDGRKRGLVCPNGHAYAGNEMPDNKMGWRCRTCYLAWRDEHGGGGLNAGQRNALKTMCPKRHPYEGENLILLANGRRRCRTCNNEQSRTYAARRAA